MAVGTAVGPQGERHQIFIAKRVLAIMLAASGRTARCCSRSGSSSMAFA